MQIAMALMVLVRRLARNGQFNANRRSQTSPTLSQCVNDSAMKKEIAKTDLIILSIILFSISNNTFIYVYMYSICKNVMSSIVS